MFQKIPSFPHLKSLEISDEEVIKSYFSEIQPKTSDYSFANLYLWRNYDAPKITLIGDNLCVLLQPKDANPYFLFPGGKERIESTLEKCFTYLRVGPQLRMVPEEIAEKFFKGKKSYRCVLDRDNSDYLYLTKDLINLKGRKYDGKRNWINRFKANYQAEMVPLTVDLIPQAFWLLEKWAKTKRGSLLKYEIDAIGEALNNLEHLKLISCAILINDRLEAFMVADELDSETAVVYIQVANPEIAGLPQYFHWQFTAQKLASYRYVNWEQDLGQPGLRRAKLSYHPCRIIKSMISIGFELWYN
ncbi:MAG: DUF2156 domain-containing protein [Candidatus Margulisiibacteriota bacterium]